HTSGQYGLAHAAHNFHTRPVMKSLPSYFKDTGYRTGIIGKLHVLPKHVYPWDVEGVKVNPRNGVAMAREARKFFTDTKDKPFVLVMGYTDPHRAGKGFANDKPFAGIKSVKFDPKSLKLPYHLPDTTEARADLADYYQS